MITKDEAFKKISELVQRFVEQLDSYKSIEYNETLTRRDFIDPFFKALGWDVDNSQGFAEAYREVIHEDKVKVGKATKAPDYSFRLGGGKRLFFVEAKKPSVVVKDDISVAYQVRRYGWNAKLPISLVTDFEEFAVYDCTKKPNPADKSSIARIKYLTYDKYLDEFDYLWSTFSKEQVLKGSFDKYIQSDKTRKGTTTVDKEFLITLDGWRTYLATSISIKNKQLDEDEINFVVQQTIDRLIFLRIAEDRGVEPYGQLKSSVNLKGDSYQNLFFNFKKADEKYNSGLFDFRKDKISENLVIDNKTIKTIVNEMYFPSPYEFSEIPIEILGSVYEQFLGKQIKIDSAHRTKIEEKPEVRKAGGVFYTPQYVVDYIVKNTVGKLIEGKTPKQISDIKIVDPACGSGSFLIGAYQFLLDFHKNYYTENGTRTGKKDSPTTPSGNLTSAEKKRILLNNIYGVDIDVNAVEVTKLSLLLKCMEGETETTLAQQYQLWHERILPTLDNNIKSGNSLVDTDFYNGKLDFGGQKKIKPFNWETAFPEVFNRKISDPNREFAQIAQKAKEHAKKAMEYATELEQKLSLKEPKSNYKNTGGFDIVIGNPPYGALLLKEEDDYLRLKYLVANYQLDTYCLFIEKGKKLLTASGYLGYIIPSAWVASTFDNKLRKYIIENAKVDNIVITPKQTFKDATVETCILILSNNQQGNSFDVERWDLNEKNTYLVDLKQISSDTGYVFPVYADEFTNRIVNKIRRNLHVLNDFADVIWGTKVYENGKGKPPQTGDESKSKVFHSAVKSKQTHRPLLGGSEINRYSIKWKGRYIDYGEWLAAPRQPHWFDGERILVREVTSNGIIQATYINSDFVFSNSVDGIKMKSQEIDIKYLLGLLNSKLISFYHVNTSPNAFKGTFPKLLLQDLRHLPIAKPNEEDHNEIISLVNNLLLLYQALFEASIDSKKQLIQGKIDFYESAIDKIVYKLNDLNMDEIQIIQGNINKT